MRRVNAERWYTEGMDVLLEEGHSMGVLEIRSETLLAA